MLLNQKTLECCMGTKGDKSSEQAALTDEYLVKRLSSIQGIVF